MSRGFKSSTAASVFQLRCCLGWGLCYLLDTLGWRQLAKRGSWAFGFELHFHQVRKVPCGLMKELELGELFRTGAKCEPGRVVLGGWLIGSRADPSKASWFSLTLTPAEAPWLFRGPDQESSWASTSAELLGSLVALSYHQVWRRHRQQGGQFGHQ